MMWTRCSREWAGPLAKLWCFFISYVDGLPSAPSHTTRQPVILEEEGLVDGSFTSLPSTASAPASLRPPRALSQRGLGLGGWGGGGSAHPRRFSHSSMR